MSTLLAAAAPQGFALGRPASRQIVTGALYVDPGVDENGRRVREPRARYECLRCRTTEGPVEGVGTVATFTEHVRAVHRTRCAAIQESARE